MSSYDDFCFQCSSYEGSFKKINEIIQQGSTDLEIKLAKDNLSHAIEYKKIENCLYKILRHLQKNIGDIEVEKLLLYIEEGDFLKRWKKECGVRS